MSMLTKEYKAALAALTAAQADLSLLKDTLKSLGADAVLMGAGMLPPPLGTAADIASLGISLGRGDWVGAFWDTVGLIPIVGDGAKAAAKGGRAAKQLKAIKKAVAKVEKIIAKKQDDLAKLCKKSRVGKDKTRQATKESDCAVCGGGGKIAVKNTKTRLPRTDGKWDGKPGEGKWHSDLDDVNKVTGGKPIPFKNGRPDFSEWSKGSVKFKPGQLDGTKEDFNLVYDYVADKKGLASRNAAKNYLREKGLTPHHLDNNTIQLIPSKLHGNIPHIGSASDLRGGF
jgi:hypothetical protein